MKNLMKNALLIFACLIANKSIANDIDSSIKIKLIETKLIQLTMNGNVKMVEVSVKDLKGEVIYRERSENFNLAKKYDLKNLPNGNYFIEIESSTKIKVIPFVVLSKSIELQEDNELTYYKPVVRKEGVSLFISKLNLNNENLEIFLYDGDSNLLFSEKLAGNSILEKKLNLKNLNSGDYNLVLRGGRNTFYETIKL